MNERMPIYQIAYAEYFDRWAFFGLSESLTILQLFDCEGDRERLGRGADILW